MLPLVHEVPKLEITWGGEGAAWRAVTTNLHCSCPLPLTLLLVSWRELTGPAGPLVWPSVLFSTYWTSSCPDKSFQPVKFAGACCMKKLRAWAFQKCKVKGGKNDLFVCFTEGDWKMGDSWYPGLTASCPLVLPSVQVSWIWCELWMAQSLPTMNCLSAQAVVRVGGVGVPRLDPDLESTSAAISGCGVEAEPPGKPVFQNMIRKKLPFCFLATYPRDLSALTSSRDTLGQSIVSDSWTWWARPLDFSVFGGVLSCCI